MKVLLLFVLSFVVAFSACDYANEEELTPENGCNAMDVSYINEVIPILEASCISCHNSAGSLGGVNLETYDGVAFVAENGTLSGSINHADGFSPMPQGMPKLDSCTIAKIDSWIDDGYRNH